jgi:hypothetical protein
MKNIDKCLNCKKNLEKSLVNLGKTPIANNLLLTTEKVKTFILNAKFCEKCFLVQVNPGLKPKDLFKEYSYQSGHSTTWKKHCDKIAHKLNKFKVKKNDLILEVASNDGTQLDSLKDKGFKKIYGIDPSKNLAKTVRKRGYNITCDFFGSKSAKNFISKHGKAKVTIANNVIAHIPDINDFCSGLNEVIDDDGIAIIEFHYLIELIKNNEFDTIYHEHHFYHSLYSINRILLNNGLKIYNYESISTHGGSIRIYVSKYLNQRKKISTKLLNQMKYELKIGINKNEFYSNFNSKIKRYKKNFIKKINIIRKNNKIYGYGAAAKSCTFIHHMNLQNYIHAIYDKNPYKQERYIPNTNIQILSPNKIKKDKPKVIIVFIWNLKKEILKELKFTKKWGAKIIFCLPEFKIF